MKPVWASLAHYVLLHRVAWLLARTYFVPFVIARFELLFYVIVVRSGEINISANVSLLFKLFKSKNFAFPIDTLYKYLIKMLCGEHLLHWYLVLVFFLHFQFLKVEVPPRVVPLDFQFAKIFVGSVCWHYSKNFPDQVSILIVKTANVPNFKNLIFELKLGVFFLLWGFSWWWCLCWKFTWGLRGNCSHLKFNFNTILIWGWNYTF